MSKRQRNAPGPGHYKVQGHPVEDNDVADLSKQALVRLTAAEPRGTLDAFADAVVERAKPHLSPARDLDVAVAVAGPWPHLGDDLAALVIARLRALGLRSVARGDGDAAWARAAGYE